MSPKPGIALGSVKSQAFSESPTKSRMAGSAVHARRSAARVSSGGTPGIRKARTSLADVIESSEGSLLKSNAGLVAAGNSIVEPVPMPDPIRDVVAAFVALHHVEEEFVKRKRDRANLESLGRRAPAVRGDRE